MMRKIYSTVSFLMIAGSVFAGTVDESQTKYVKQYEKQKNVPNPAKQLVNIDAEPNLKTGFKPLFNGKDLTGWTSKGGQCTFEVKDGAIMGTCVKKTPSTWLCTDKEYGDFIFTCEVKWLVDGNSGVQFRSKARGKVGKETVYGPQYELEGFARGRNWTGGIYGQSCGGWYYPLWLEAHQKARAAVTHEWNRVTILAKGNVVKTWINGVPATHWLNDTYLKGFIGLQVHQGSKGQILWRNVKIKELK